MTKPIRIKMTNGDGIVYWTVQHRNATLLETGRKPRKISGWAFRDHEGCERFSEGNWMALVGMFRLVAGNYGFSTTIS